MYIFSKNKKPTRFINNMPTEYHQSFRDNFKSVNSKEELDRLKDRCCENCRFTCGLKPCAFENDYILYREIIDEIRKPSVVYSDKPDPKLYIPRPPEQDRIYKIKPKTDCARVCKGQISKMSKKITDNNVLDILSQVYEHVKGFRFKRAYNICVKNGINNLAKILGKFIENN